MRLDKYLKVSRILKRRSVSKELALHQRILVNDKLAKPSTDVKINDTITITFGNRQIQVLVKETKDFVRKDDANVMYEVIDEKYLDEPNNP